MKPLFLLNFFIIIVLVHLHAQDNTPFISENSDSISKDFYKKYQLPSYRPNYSSPSFLEIKVMEVDTSSKPFSDDSGSIFGYCGDIEGGIKNLLQNKLLYSSSHIKFLNQPNEKRCVLFYGRGLYMNGMIVGDTAKNCYPDDSHVKGRDIILKIMATEFGFDVQEIIDSLDVIELRVLDSFKLKNFLIPESQRYVGGSGLIYTKTKEYQSIRAHLSFIPIHIGRIWNVVTYDETNTDNNRYDFTIPAELFDSSSQFSQFNAYIEPNLGLTLIKTKRLEKVYTIQFKNQ